MSESRKCPYCTRTFGDANALWQHSRDKHRDKPLAKVRADRDAECDDEPSIADQMVEAQLKRAMGDPLDPFEESLIDMTD